MNDSGTAPTDGREVRRPLQVWARIGMRTNRTLLATLGMLLGVGVSPAQYLPYQQTQAAPTPAPMPMTPSPNYPSTAPPKTGTLPVIRQYTVCEPKRIALSA